MKSRLSSLVIVGAAVASSLTMLPLYHVDAQDDRPGLRAQRATSPSTEPQLRRFEFETVTFDSSGSINRRKGQAQYFSEDINGVALEMVEVPGGTFLMGSPLGEADRSNDEGPQHQVAVQTFFMGKYEVMQAQWRAVAGLPRVKRDLNPNPSLFKGDNLPVEQVTWEEAVEFCDRLSKATGRRYRLPSEAEWEYACRAGTTTPFAFGAKVGPEFVNYNCNMSYPYAAGARKTTPVGDMEVSNKFGLYDMHGNVWEWCQDAWHDTYDNAPTDGSAWEQGGNPRQRVLRGGAWIHASSSSRAASRYWLPPALQGVNSAGFRVVLAARSQIGLN